MAARRPRPSLLLGLLVAAQHGPRPGAGVRAGPRRLVRAALPLLAASGEAAVEEEGLDLGDLASIFRQFDSDYDGVINRQEYMRLASKANPRGDDSIAAWFDELFRQADVDPDRRLTPRETEYLCHLAHDVFNSAGSHVERGENLHTRQDAVFRGLDLNHNGLVDFDEFWFVVESAASQESWERPSVSSLLSWSRRGFDKADMNGDGSLNAAEASYSFFLMRDAVRSGLIERMATVDLLFELGDLDQDGLLRREDVERMRVEIRDDGNFMLHISALFGDADVDKNGALDVDEALALMELIGPGGG